MLGFGLGDGEGAVFGAITADVGPGIAVAGLLPLVGDGAGQAVGVGGGCCREGSVERGCATDADRARGVGCCRAVGGIGQVEGEGGFARCTRGIGADHLQVQVGDTRRRIAAEGVGAGIKREPVAGPAGRHCSPGAIGLLIFGAVGDGVAFGIGEDVACVKTPTGTQRGQRLVGQLRSHRRIVDLRDGNAGAAHIAVAGAVIDLPRHGAAGARVVAGGIEGDGLERGFPLRQGGGAAGGFQRELAIGRVVCREDVAVSGAEVRAVGVRERQQVAIDLARADGDRGAGQGGAVAVVEVKRRVQRLGRGVFGVGGIAGDRQHRGGGGLGQGDGAGGLFKNGATAGESAAVFDKVVA